MAARGALLVAMRGWGAGVAVVLTLSAASGTAYSQTWVAPAKTPLFSTLWSSTAPGRPVGHSASRTSSATAKSSPLASRPSTSAPFMRRPTPSDSGSATYFSSSRRRRSRRQHFRVHRQRQEHSHRWLRRPKDDQPRPSRPTRPWAGTRSSWSSRATAPSARSGPGIKRRESSSRRRSRKRRRSRAPASTSIRSASPGTITATSRVRSIFSVVGLGRHLPGRSLRSLGEHRGEGRSRRRKGHHLSPRRRQRRRHPRHHSPPQRTKDADCPDLGVCIDQDVPSLPSRAASTPTARART